MIEMNYFQVDGAGTHINPHAWNNVATMLYLESPAGAGGSSGFSTCTSDGKIVDCCWDDKTQGYAYGQYARVFHLKQINKQKQNKTNKQIALSTEWDSAFNANSCAVPSVWQTACLPPLCILC